MASDDAKAVVRSAWAAALRPDLARLPERALPVLPEGFAAEEWPEREEALRLYPLPDGMPDAVLNRMQLATAMGVSENTISKWRLAGMPCREEGASGREWEFVLSECYAWKMMRDAKARRTREEGDRAAAQMRMFFRNDEDAEAEATTLTAKEIKEESDAEIARLKAAQLRGELVPVERVRDAIERAVVGFRNGMITLPDFAEIELGLSPEDVDKLQGWVDGVLHELEIRINAAVDPEGEVRAFKARNAE